MIDLQTIIREYLSNGCYTVTFNRLVQFIREGLLKGDSERTIHEQLQPYYRQSLGIKTFELWARDRIENRNLGYGIVFDLETDIITNIIDSIAYSISQMPDIKVTFSFKHGIRIHSESIQLENPLNLKIMYNEKEPSQIESK